MNPEFPPPNRAIGWYRFMLWMMPTCIALTTAFAIGWLSDVLRIRGGFPVGLWCFLNIATTIGIGIFESRFDRIPAHPALSNQMPRALRFVLLQFFIIPLMSFAIAFAACLFGGLV
jgi:hypothetical protein